MFHWGFTILEVSTLWEVNVYVNVLLISNYIQIIYKHRNTSSRKYILTLVEVNMSLTHQTNESALGPCILTHTICKVFCMISSAGFEKTAPDHLWNNVINFIILQLSYEKNEIGVFTYLIRSSTHSVMTVSDEGLVISRYPVQWFPTFMLYECCSYGLLWTMVFTNTHTHKCKYIWW